jgi:hypothetical protein
MNNRIFRPKNEARRKRATKLPSYSTLFALVGLLMLLATGFLFIKTSADDIDAKNEERPGQNFTNKITPLAPPPTIDQAREAYGQLPMSFEANHGQADGGADFVSRGAGYTLTLSPTQAAFRLRKADWGLRNVETADFENPQSEFRIPKSARPQSAVLQMSLVGANPAAKVAGQNELEGRVNYFIGNDPAKWRTNVPTFGRVRYAEVYPGIDVVYYGNQKKLEYDFVVAPGSDARAIALEFVGADEVEVDGATGDLMVRVGEETIRQLAPVTYQELGGARKKVESRYALRGGGRVEFEVGEYDASAPLVIDPVLQYSTYLGGSNDDGSSGIAVDSAGNAYVTGSTNSANFPTANAIQGTLFPSNGDVAGDYDVFVTKINAAGTALVYSTYLGGNTGEGGLAIALDSAGNAYITGFTRSTNFPTANPIDSTYGGGNDGFVTKINAAGSALVYSTYLGGNGADFSNDIAVDSAGSAYLTGDTSSTNFPSANGRDPTYNGGQDAFVTKINAGGTAFVYSTYLGGTEYEFGNGIAVDSAGNAYIAGRTRSPNFPTFNAIQPTFAGDADAGDTVVIQTGDAFVTKLNAAGSALVYSTYLGGTVGDAGYGIALDSANNAYVTGRTNSPNFPTANAIDSTYNTREDAFVTKINAAGTALVYSNFLGGNDGDSGQDIAVDSAGNAYIAGDTFSNNFPTVNPSQGTRAGNFDVFVTKINGAGSVLVYSTYLGGSGRDAGAAIAVDPAGNAYVAGETPPSCIPFPTTTGAFDTTFNGGDNNGSGDAFISKISETASPSTLTAYSSFLFSQSSYVVSESAGFVNVNVTRLGDTSTVATVDYTTSDNSGVIPDEAQAVALCGTVNGIALSKCDFNTAVGTLRFAPGETIKSFTVLLTQDSYVEGTESAPLTLSNPIGASLCETTVSLFILDDATEPATNSIDDSRNFVRQHYHDFLNREPDQAGWDFWTDNIAKCNDPARRPPGQTVAQCIDKQRETTSGAFFLSPEFQYTGSYIYGVYKGSLNRRPTFLEFMRDMPQLVNGIIVGGQISGPVIEANRAQYVAQFIQRTEFANIYGALNNQGYVDKLFQTTGTAVTDADKQALVTGLNGGSETRSSVLHKVVNGTRVIAEGQIEIIAVYGKAFYDTQFNPAFVQMEYFGYMRRNEDTAGFNFWLGKLNFYGDFITAEMVRSFLLSPEYRRRFGSQ